MLLSPKTTQEAKEALVGAVLRVFEQLVIFFHLANSRAGISAEFTGNDGSPNIKSQLFAKESQISVLKAKLSDTEKKLEKRSQDYYEMKAEKEMLEKRVENQKVSTQEMDSLQELKLARKKAQDQKEKAVEECNSLKRKIVALEEEVRAMVEQLRLAKFNLNENKKEFDEYKNKAQKILMAKEKLVESLKSEASLCISGKPKPIAFSARNRIQ